MDLYARHEDVLHADVNGEIIVMNPETLDYFELNGAAPRIWELLEGGPVSVQALTKQLTDEFDIDHDSCSDAVEAFLKSAVDSGVVVMKSVSGE